MMVLGTQISTLYYIIYVSKGVKPYGKSPSHKQHFCFFPEFSVSRFVLETGNRNWGFCVFFQYSQSNVEIVFQIRLHLPLSIYFSFLFFTDHPFDAVCTPLNKEWFIKQSIGQAVCGLLNNTHCRRTGKQRCKQHIVGLSISWRWMASFMSRPLGTPVRIENQAEWAPEPIWAFWRRRNPLALRPQFTVI